MGFKLFSFSTTLFRVLTCLHAYGIDVNEYTINFGLQRNFNTSKDQCLINIFSKIERLRSKNIKKYIIVSYWCIDFTILKSIKICYFIKVHST